MPGRVEGKVALVNGAGSAGPGWGNGKAAAVLYAREGARVVCVDVRREAAEETVGIIRGEGGDAVAIAGDSAEAATAGTAVAAALDRFGGLHILHNNVGIVSASPTAETDDADWDRVIRVNQRSYFLACKHAIPAMLAGGGGAIVNIASIAAIGWLGVPYASYAASKAAIVGFTRHVALEHAARGIRCNAILPGLMDTPMIRAPLAKAYGGSVEAMLARRAAQCPMGFMGDAWDVARAALFLASDEARYITGAELVVDGGMTVRNA
jgi:NAD(P)-dependent dehydrogenase (short-subunit alcohol dehydrogenase family)